MARPRSPVRMVAWVVVLVWPWSWPKPALLPMGLNWPSLAWLVPRLMPTLLAR